MDVPSPERADWIVVVLTSDDARRSVRFTVMPREGALMPKPTKLLPVGFAAADPKAEGEDARVGPLPGKRISARHARKNMWLHVAVAEALTDRNPAVLTVALETALPDDVRVFDALLNGLRDDGTLPSSSGRPACRIGRFVLPIPESMRLAYADLRGAYDSIQAGWESNGCTQVASAMGKPSGPRRTSSGFEWSVVDRSAAERTALVSFGERCLWASHDCHADREFSPHPDQAHRERCLPLETIVERLVLITAPTQ